MQFWFDTEFIEDGKTIELVSIGMVRGDGATLYLESNEFDASKADDWVKKNVLAKLTGPAMSRAHIAQHVKQFVDESHEVPQFIAYYADYDWVVFCQLFGRMIDLPDHWPKYCYDFKQWLADNGNPPLQKLAPHAEHNARSDALWLSSEWLRLVFR